MCLQSPEVAFQGGLGGDQGSSHPPDGFGEPNPGAATPAEDGKLWDNTHGAVDVELGFFIFSSPLIAAAILTQPDISLTIGEAHKCLICLSLHARAAASAGLWGKKGPDWSPGMGQRLQGEDPAPDPHGKAPSHPSAPVLSSPRFLEGDPTAQPPCNMALCCRNLKIEPEPSGGFAALRGIYSCRQTLGAAGIAASRDPAPAAAGVGFWGDPPGLGQPRPRCSLLGTRGNPTRDGFGVLRVNPEQRG